MIAKMRIWRSEIRKNSIKKESESPFGNSTGEDWEQLQHCQIFFYDDGTHEETRG